MTSIIQIEKYPPCLLCGNSANRKAHSAAFKDYVYKHCPRYTLRQAMKLVHEGEVLVQKFAKGKTVSHKDPMRKLSPFICIEKSICHLISTKNTTR